MHREMFLNSILFMAILFLVACVATPTDAPAPTIAPAAIAQPTKVALTTVAPTSAVGPSSPSAHDVDWITHRKPLPQPNAPKPKVGAPFTDPVFGMRCYGPS